MNRFDKAIWVSIGLVGVVAMFDFFTYPKAFWLYSIALAVILSIIYFIFSKDTSESIAVFAAFFIMLMFGLEDLLFYTIRPIFQSTTFGIPESLPHLMSHPIIGKVAGWMGLTTVTPSSLIISVIIGGIITYYTIKYLKGVSL